MERHESLDALLELLHRLRRNDFEPRDAVRVPLFLQLVQRRDVRLVERHRELPDPLDLQPEIPAQIVHQRVSADVDLRAQTSRLVVEPGVHNAAVSAARSETDIEFLFDQCNPNAIAGKLPRDRAPYDASSDDENIRIRIIHRQRASPPGIPNMRPVKRHHLLVAKFTTCVL